MPKTITAAIQQNQSPMSYKQFVLAAYAPIDDTDLEAEAIIDDVPVNFIELVAMNGGISEVTRKHEALATKYGQRVIVLHIGSVSRILNAMQGE